MSDWIVALEPVSGPLDLYGYSSPAEVMPVVEAALKQGWEMPVARGTPMR